MKRFIYTLVCLLILNLQVFAVDYSDSKNWVINENDKQNTDFDVFYIYPTISRSDTELLFDWSNPKNSKFAYKFSKAQTSEFNQKKVRVFAPFIRQAELDTALADISKIKTMKGDYHVSMASYGIDDTKDALKYYLEHYNNGRPYILLGHSQGAVDLLFAMKDNQIDNNFLVAYLIGHPFATEDELTFDDIKPATGKDDLKVIVTWNSQRKGAENKYFSTENACVINPLNWRTDEKPACRLKNVTSSFFDLESESDTKYIIKAHFITGAKVDKKNGVLLVNLPNREEFNRYAQFAGEGVYHSFDVWTFSRAIAKNAELRYKKYKKLYLKNNL